MTRKIAIFDTTLRDGEQSPRRIDELRREIGHHASTIAPRR